MGICLIEGGAAAAGGGKGKIEVLGFIDVTNAAARGLQVLINENNNDLSRFYFQTNGKEAILAENININDYTFLAIEATAAGIHPYAYLQVYFNDTTSTNNKLGNLGFATLKNWEDGRDDSNNVTTGQSRYSYFFSPERYNKKGLDTGNIIVKSNYQSGDTQFYLKNITLYGIKGEIEE